MESENFGNMPVFYDDFLDLWQEINGKQKSENWEEKYTHSCQLLNQSAIHNNQFVTIFDTLKQEIVFLSDNIKKVLGENFSQEYYQYHPVLFWVKNGHFKQVWFIMKLSLFFRNKLQKIFAQDPQNSNAVWYFHNVRFNNSPNVIGIRGESLEIAKNGAMRLQMSVMHEVSSYVKDRDVWWAEVRINENTYYYFTGDTNKFNEGRLFSVRELEIIKLVSEGKESKEIAEMLFLSNHTVDTHRKNVLKKSGLKDFSSLIYILKMYDSI
jgi:DNA-binding CsgD family transcriptional regulator